MKYLNLSIIKYFYSIVFIISPLINFGQGCFLNASAESELGELSKNSGNPNLDKILNQEYLFLTQKFLVSPDIFYFVDGNSPNAFAHPGTTNNLAPDGHIAIGFNLIVSECRNSYSGTCSAIAIIMAHEFAHIVDMKYGSGLTSSKHKELFADYLAGVYMFYRSQQFKTVFVQEAAMSFFNKGDYEFNSQQHHGTPQQRYAALMEGFNKVRLLSMQGRFLNLEQAISSARNFVVQL
jgi:hypothetical protein